LWGLLWRLAQLAALRKQESSVHDQTDSLVSWGTQRLCFASIKIDTMRKLTQATTRLKVRNTLREWGPTPAMMKFYAPTWAGREV
jgi:hypothetical protein